MELGILDTPSSGKDGPGVRLKDSKKRNNFAEYMLTLK